MGNITPTLVLDRGAVQIWKWASMGDDDTGLPVRCGPRSDVTVQVTGTPASETTTWQGTLDPDLSGYFPLTDQGGNAVEFTVVGGKMIAEAVYAIRPVTSGGSGTAIDCYAKLEHGG